MKSQWQTHDGHTVRTGDQVWVQNGSGPFILTDPKDIDHRYPSGYVWLMNAHDRTDGMLFADEDIPIMAYRVRPTPY